MAENQTQSGESGPAWLLAASLLLCEQPYYHNVEATENLVKSNFGGMTMEATYIPVRVNGGMSEEVR